MNLLKKELFYFSVATYQDDEQVTFVGYLFLLVSVADQ